MYAAELALCGSGLSGLLSGGWLDGKETRKLERVATHAPQSRVLVQLYTNSTVHVLESSKLVMHNKAIQLETGNRSSNSTTCINIRELMTLDGLTVPCNTGTR